MSNVNTALVIGGGIAGRRRNRTAQGRYRSQRLRGVSAPERRHRRCARAEPNGLAALGVIGAAEAVRAVATPITRSLLPLAASGSATSRASRACRRVR